jgi:hypothetical protein
MFKMTTKFTKFLYTVPKGHKTHQMAINIPAVSNLMPSKAFPNWYFWYANKPSGNPGTDASFASL